jgi:hypothetical protein
MGRECACACEECAIQNRANAQKYVRTLEVAALLR